MSALRMLQGTAVLTLLVLMWQFATAGQILSASDTARELHGTGAIALHVISAATMLSAAAHWWLRRAPVVPTILAALVFALSFVQAYLGESGALWLHVPGALVLTVGAVWVTAWSFTSGARL
jgi:hypothetical protein